MFLKNERKIQFLSVTTTTTVPGPWRRSVVRMRTVVLITSGCQKDGYNGTAAYHSELSPQHESTPFTKPF